MYDGRKSEEVGVKRLQFQLPRAIKGCTVEQPAIETFEALTPEYENFQPSQTAPTHFLLGILARQPPATHAFSHADTISSAPIRFSPPFFHTDIIMGFPDTFSTTCEHEKT